MKIRHPLAIKAVGVAGAWMVRRLVGILVEVGRGGLTPEAAAAMLTAPSELPARLTAPASGLFLERVRYEGDDRPAPAPPNGVGSHFLRTLLETTRARSVLEK